MWDDRNHHRNYGCRLGPRGNTPENLGRKFRFDEAIRVFPRIRIIVSPSQRWLIADAVMGVKNQCANPVRTNAVKRWTGKSRRSLPEVLYRKIEYISNAGKWRFLVVDFPMINCAEEAGVRFSETKPGPATEPERLNEDLNPVLPGVPNSIAVPFLRGLDDVRSGRVVDGDAVLAESRALLARYRQKKRKA